MPRNVWPLDMEFYGKSFRLRSSHSNIMRALDFLRLWSLITCWKSQGTLHFWYYLLFWYLLDIHFIWSSVFSSRVTGIGSGSKYSARSASFKETEENKVFFLSKGLMVLIQARSTQSTSPPSWRGKLLSRCKLELCTMTRAILIIFCHPISFQWPLFIAAIFLMSSC